MEQPASNAFSSIVLMFVLSCGNDMRPGPNVGDGGTVTDASIGVPDAAARDPFVVQCEETCAHLYGDCGIQLYASGGGAVDQETCSLACSRGDLPQSYCLHDVACVELAIDECFFPGLSLCLNECTDLMNNCTQAVRAEVDACVRGRGGSACSAIGSEGNARCASENDACVNSCYGG